MLSDTEIKKLQPTGKEYQKSDGDGLSLVVNHASGLGRFSGFTYHQAGGDTSELRQSVVIRLTILGSSSKTVFKDD